MMVLSMVSLPCIFLTYIPENNTQKYKPDLRNKQKLIQIYYVVLKLNREISKRKTYFVVPSSKNWL